MDTRNRGGKYDIMQKAYDTKANIVANLDKLVPLELVISTDTHEILYKDEQGNLVHPTPMQVLERLEKKLNTTGGTMTGTIHTTANNIITANNGMSLYAGKDTIGFTDENANWILYYNKLVNELISAKKLSCNILNASQYIHLKDYYGADKKLDMWYNSDAREGSPWTANSIYIRNVDRAFLSNAELVATSNLSKGETGYIKFTNGFIIQWGFCEDTSSSTGGHYLNKVTFPTAFTSLKWVDVQCLTGFSNVYGIVINPLNSNNTGFTPYVAQTGAFSGRNIKWFAFGF